MGDGTAAAVVSLKAKVCRGDKDRQRRRAGQQNLAGWLAHGCPNALRIMAIDGYVI